MKNKKGFTLIELLAVIVILAIIALIATPIILNMIENAKKGAAKDSAYGYIEAIEYNNSMSDLGLNNGYTKISGEKLDVTGLEVKIKGSKPESGEVTIDKSGRVTSADLCINGYKVIYETNKVAKVTKSNECVSNKETNDNPSTDSDNNSETNTGDSSTNSGNNSETDPESGKDDKEEDIVANKIYKASDVVYYDPVNNKKCDNYETSLTSTVTGCLKWYVITTDDNSDKTTVDIILDHNSTDQSIAATDQYIKKELDRLVNDIEWKKTPRIISADEVAKITGADVALGFKVSNNDPDSWFYLDGKNGSDTTWHTKVASNENISEYHWLYDYTQNCILNKWGCKYEDRYDLNGYWQIGYVTSSIIATNRVCVTAKGTLDFRAEEFGNAIGIRPVIEVNKSDIQ